MKIRRWIQDFRLWAGLLALTSLLVASGCGSLSATDKSGGSKPPQFAQDPKKRDRKYPVRVAPVISQPVKYELRALGTTEAQDVYRIDSRVPGTIYEVSFNEGDEVKADQVLCKIAPEAYKFAERRQEAEYRQAVANFEDAKRRNTFGIERAKVKLKESEVEVARRKAVKEAGAISEEEIQLYESRRDLAAIDVRDMTEAVKTELKVLEATIGQKEAMWRIAEDDVKKSTVRAPIGGTIAQKAVTNMMFVPSGTMLAKIIDTRTLKLRFKISERDSAGIQNGTEVFFTVPAHPNREFKATVYHISDQLDSQQRSLECLARITEDVKHLKSGYFAAVRIVTQAKEKTIVAPTMALLPTEKGFVAFVAKDNKAVRREIQIGLTVTDDSFEILSGLSEGESLIVAGANALQDGYELRILNEKKDGDAGGAKGDKQ